MNDLNCENFYDCMSCSGLGLPTDQQCDYCRESKMLKIKAVILKTRKFTLVDSSITKVVMQWNRRKESFDQFHDIEILSIEEMEVQTPESNPFAAFGYAIARIQEKIVLDSLTIGSEG